MARVFFFIFIFSFLSCGTKKVIENRKGSPSIPTETLLKRGIVTPNLKYKRWSNLPYLFYNLDNAFIELKGDYISLKHPIYKEVNIIAGFRKKERKYKNVLKVQIWIEALKASDLKTLDIKVTSSKHGAFSFKHFQKNGARKSNKWVEYLYIKQLHFKKSKEVLKMVDDDVITVVVNGYTYKLLNPELSLK